MSDEREVLILSEAEWRREVVYRYGKDVTYIERPDRITAIHAGDAVSYWERPVRHEASAPQPEAEPVRSALPTPPQRARTPR
jgi:hypothetical protein